MESLSTPVSAVMATMQVPVPVPVPEPVPIPAPFPLTANPSPASYMSEAEIRVCYV